MLDGLYNKKLKAEYQFLQLECKYQQNLFDEALKEFTIEFKEYLNKDVVSGIEKKKLEKKSLDKIYKKLATKVHPDKSTGNHKEFQKLTKLIDDSDLDGLKEMADEYNVKMEIDLEDKPIAMEDGLRFAIREGGRTVGSGVVTKIIE